MVRRNFIFKTIREVFEKYGYQPIETPAMENLETLTGKYGEEGDKLIFKVLDSGNYFEDLVKELGDKIVHQSSGTISSHISEKALRYDLTVPYARYVVQHQNEITFPFKRYQIQPVWRADKPQKGRYREFYQCDADVIGSDSLLNEVELVQMMVDVFLKLQIPFAIKYNNRKILTGLAEIFGVKDKFMDLIVAIDKYEKVGDAIYDELKQKGFQKETIEKVQEFITNVTAEEAGKKRHNIAKEYFSKSKIGSKGFEEIALMNTMIAEALKGQDKNILDNIRHDMVLARGINYYTGAIFEVKTNNVHIGSICGGGRYDDLTGNFGLPNVSGVGISFGIDRIFDVMNELNSFEKLNLSASTTKVLLVHFGEEERKYCIGVASQLRSAGINTEIYPDITKKISKQFDYANKKQIPFVIVVGGDEMKTGELTLKNMTNGEQKKMKLEPLIAQINTN